MAHMKAQQNKVKKANAADDDDVDDNDDEDIKPCPTPAGRRWLELSEHCCWPPSSPLAEKRNGALGGTAETRVLSSVSTLR